MSRKETLRQLYDEVSSLSSILRKDKLLEFCDRVDEPFDSNGEYVELVKVRILVRGALLKENEHRQRSFFSHADPDVSENELSVQETITKRVESLNNLDAILMDIYNTRVEQSRVEPTEHVPRILRLFQKLDLDEWEKQFLHYQLFISCDIGDALLNTISLSSSIQEAAKLFNFETTDLLELTSDNNTLIESGVCELHETAVSGELPDVKLPLEHMKVLRGLSLTKSEFLKIEGTPIAELLREEPGFQHESPSGDGDGQSELEPEGGKMDETQEKERASDYVEDPGNQPSIPDEEEDFDISAFLNREHKSDDKVLKTERADEQSDVLDDSADQEVLKDQIRPYRNNLDYLQDQFEWIEQIVECRRIESKDELVSEDRSKEALLREYRAKERRLRNRCRHRLQKTRNGGSWIPRVERLSEIRNYSKFERNVILLLMATHMHSFEDSGVRNISLKQSMSVDDILTIWCDDLKSRVNHRKYFYKNSKLVKDGVIQLDSSSLFSNNLSRTEARLDRRMLDYLTGLEYESGELVEGSHLYTPDVEMDQVVLSEDKKNKILDAVENFDEYQEARSDFGFEEIIPYGQSMVLMFYGPSGTGKTMMGNALANYLNKKLMLINYPTLGGMLSDQVIKYIFREARINDAILFFDECEELFSERERGNRDVSLLLTEFEQYDGLIIMATNRPQVLDEAMHRRITMTYHFPKPDHQLRRKIWQVHLPEQIEVENDIDLDYLSYNYELTGGLIKNAVLTGLNQAVKRDSEELEIREEDLETGAQMQMRSHLKMGEFEEKITPNSGLDTLVLPDDLMSSLRKIVDTEKSKKVLFGQWGFREEKAEFSPGTAMLFYGPPGTGKTFTAKSIGFELGRSLKRVNMATLVSKWVGETGENLEGVFKEAEQSNSILFFDEAEALFAERTEVGSASDRYANLDVNLLLQLIEDFEGMVILTTNKKENLDDAMFRRIEYRFKFPIPGTQLRKQLWKKLLPNSAPTEEHIDYNHLAEEYKLAGGNIKNAIYRAASEAALRKGEDRVIRQEDLRKAAEEETDNRTDREIGFD